MRFEPENRAENDKPFGGSQNSGQLFSNRSASAPPPSRPHYHRLIMLICLLGFTIYAMIEAGKPERWHWLIPPDGDLKKVNVIELDPKPDDGTNELTDSATQLLTDSNSSPNDSNSVKPKTGDDLSGLSPGSADFTSLSTVKVSDYPTSAKKYWMQTIQKMTPKDRTLLFQLLRFARTNSNPDEPFLKAVETLLKSIQATRSRFHEQLLSDSTYTTLGAEKKSELANELFESDQAWNREELPALTAFRSGKALDSLQLESIQRLQAVLDPIVYSLIEDQTAQGWEGDMPGWQRMWEILPKRKTETKTRVTHLEMMAQPDDYRGKLVAVSGWVRGAWKEKLTVKELGIDSLYVLAVRPEDSKVSPYFVYLTTLPKGWPMVTEKYVNLSQRVEITGLFFKIRTYIDTEKKVREAPMILASDVTAVAEKRIPVVEAKIFDNPYVVIGGLIGMIALAAIVARIAFRTTETFRFKPGANRTREINEQLDILASDPEVKSNRDRIQDLYD